MRLVAGLCFSVATDCHARITAFPAPSPRYGDHSRFACPWGMSRHSDFDMLFNHERRQWQRDRVSDKWLELKVPGANLP